MSRQLQRDEVLEAPHSIGFIYKNVWRKQLLEKRKRKQTILLILVILTLCFIWGNSLLPASVSGGISGWAKDIINNVFGSTRSMVLLSDGVLRKIAHATEFAVLGIGVAQLWRMWKKPFGCLFLCGLFTALIDETIQLFVVGRAGQVKDIWIDFCGFCIGVVTIILFG